MNKENIKSKIVATLDDKETSALSKITKLQEILKKTTEIDPDLVELINFHFKGKYGSEYLTIQGNYQTIIDFYDFLNKRFPDSAEILFSLGDLFLLHKQHKKSFDAFNQAFYQNPLLLFKAPGELENLLEKYGSEWQNIYYRLSFVRASLLDDSIEDAREEYHEIINIYGEDNNAIKTYLQESIIREELSPLSNKLNS